ncbi:MAG: hypothetical protein LBJ31_06110 [Treponema sp.]|nr:hypothetical protein [Treponema sp.]
MIRDLDVKRLENLRFRDQILEDLGKSLLERLAEAHFPGGEGELYRRYIREIGDFENSIKTIQGALARIRDLDEEISVRKQEKADREDEAVILYRRLGCRLLLYDGLEEPVLAAVRREMGPCRERDKNLRLRLEELAGSGGFFGMIGNFFRSLRLRLALGQNEKRMDRIYLKAGRIYGEALDTSQADAPNSFSGETALLVRDTIAARQNLAELDSAAAILEAEKEKIRSSFGFREKPADRIRQLEKQAVLRREDLLGLFRKIGESAESLSGLDDTEKGALLRAQGFAQSAAGHESEMRRIEAAIEADREAERVARLEKNLAVQRGKLILGERAVVELNRKIAQGRRRIQDLGGGTHKELPTEEEQ